MFEVGDVVRICDDPSNTDNVYWVSPQMDEYKGAVGTICEIDEQPTERYHDGVYRLSFSDGDPNTYYFDGLWLSRVESADSVDTSELDAFFDGF